MSIENAVLRRNQLLSSLGKTSMNVMFPNDFELYTIAFEVIDSQDRTVEYFLFPVMPQQISESKPQIHSIKKTVGGVSSISNNTFVPTEITINGNFGRKFRVLLGSLLTDLIGSYKSKKLKKKKPEFDSTIKTGYGNCKLLESLIEESILPDELGNSKRLVFHNLALGNSYIVKCTNLTFTQSQDSNMIWNYNLTLKSIAKLESLYKNRQLLSLRSSLTINGYLQSRTDSLIDSLTAAI